MVRVNSSRAVILASIFCVCAIGISCDPRPRTDQQLGGALRIGDTNYLQQYLNSGGDVNHSMFFRTGQRLSCPLLHHALYYGQTNAIEFLLNHRANPNQTNGRGDTVLTWGMAAMPVRLPPPTRVQIIKRLLDAGADPNLKAPSEYNYTPLLEASVLGETGVVELLLRVGANVHATSTVGQTALHLAGNAEVARLLIRAGADVTARTTYGETPAEGFLHRKCFDVLNVLTNANARQ